MSIMSLVALAVSVLGVIIYGASFSVSSLTWLFIIISITSIVLPPIAKKMRIKQRKKGGVFEIIAIVIGGFNFYCIFFALTKLPLFIGYLGWIICGVVYKMVKNVQDDSESSETIKEGTEIDIEEQKTEEQKNFVYVVGEDIPVGKHIFTATNPKGGMVIVSSNTNSLLDRIYVKEQKKIKVKSGTTIKLSNCRVDFSNGND